MAKIDKHGLKMVGLKKVSGATVNNPNGYSQISYDMSTGELYEDWHVGSRMTSWSVYRDTAVINVANTSSHMKMQEIADAVFTAVQEHEKMTAWEQEILKGE